MIKINNIKLFILFAVAVLASGSGAKYVSAQAGSFTIFGTIIGITSDPNPQSLPNGPGNVRYSYTVKNFLQGLALTGMVVTDNKCRPVMFSGGDDNNDSNLDFDETWRYSCATIISQTTQSTATARGTANNITATDSAVATVVVGSNTPPPLVSIVNITKSADLFFLPIEGGRITYTYRVKNQGTVPLSDVTVSDDKCSDISGKQGDTNGNNLLDTKEVWVYTCPATISQTTTSTATVTAVANGLKAIDDVSFTVKANNFAKIIANFQTDSVPGFPNTGLMIANVNIAVWQILLAALAILVILFIIIQSLRRD